MFRTPSPFPLSRYLPLRLDTDPTDLAIFESSTDFRDEEGVDTWRNNSFHTCYPLFPSLTAIAFYRAIYRIRLSALISFQFGFSKR